jgi:serine O-acetyltransferase
MIKSDIKNYKVTFGSYLKGMFTGHAFNVVLLYRVGNWLVRHKVKVLPDRVKYKMLKKYACEISPYAQIGEALMIHHSTGIVIGHEVIIGEHCEIFQNVTIGSNRKEMNGRYMPVIGNNVSIGSGAVVVGAICIGDNVIIGANSYVDKDIPDNVIVAGVPAKIIRRRLDV